VAGGHAGARPPHARLLLDEGPRGVAQLLAMTRALREKWKQELGTRLREERVAADLSQQQIADAIDASKQLVSHWEAGRSELTLWDFVRLGSKFGFDLVYIATGSRSSRVEQGEPVLKPRGAGSLHSTAQHKHSRLVQRVHHRPRTRSQR
jgi:DNA-binding XRE family transcriptional regulator